MTKSRNQPRDIVLVGYGAQAKYAIDIFEHHESKEIRCILDVEGPPEQDTWHGYPVSEYAKSSSSLMEENLAWLICYSDNQRKKELFLDLQSSGVTFTNAIHPEAIISSSAKIGSGNIINANAVIQPHARIKDGCMIHGNTIIEHDCEISSFVNIAPGASLAGYVRVEEITYVYTNATVVPTVNIGEGVEVGAGSVVLNDVPPDTTVVGNPAQETV